MEGIGERRRVLAVLAIASWMLPSIAMLLGVGHESIGPTAFDGFWSEDFADCSLDRMYAAYDDHDSGSLTNYGDTVEAIASPAPLGTECAAHVKAVSDNGFNSVPITPRAFVSSPYIDDWDTSRDYNVSFRARVWGTVRPQRLVVTGTIDFRILVTEGERTVINSSRGEFELPPVPVPGVMLPPPLTSIAVTKPPPPTPPVCAIWYGDESLGEYPCGGTSLEPRTLVFGDLGDEPGFVNNRGEGYWDDLSLKYTKDSGGGLSVDAGPDVSVAEAEPVHLRATAAGGGVVRYWDRHTFGFDIVVGSAPAGSWITQYDLGGTPRPGIVAVTYGDGRAVFGPDDGLTGGGIPGSRNYQIFANGVLWASGRDRMEDARVLVVWGHKDILFYHSGSRNLVDALRAEGFQVNVTQYVPPDPSAFDVVVLAAVGWDWAGFSQQGVNLGYCSIASAGCPAGPELSATEVDAVLTFVRLGGGLVASAERDSGDDYLNPISKPMGVAFADLTPGSHTAVKVVDHPILRQWGSAGGASSYTFSWDLNDLVDTDGDGDPRNDADAVGESVDAVYGDDGVYRTTVVVTDSTGATATDTALVRVGNVPPSVHVRVSATATANVTFRVAGEKWHDVDLTLFRGGAVVATASVVRVPGSPDDQAVTVHGVSIDFLGEAVSAVVVYTPIDDPVNGQVNGANPAWLILTMVDGTQVRAHHTFNVLHPDTWTWTVPDLRAFLVGFPIRFEASATDPGSDDLTFAWDWGDGTSTTSVYYNDGVSPDAPSSPDVRPMDATDVQAHAFAPGTPFVVRLTVTDDDGGSVEILIDLTP